MATKRGLPPVPLPGQQDLLNVDFLLPTGMLITLSCHKMSTLADIKSAVWQEARGLPLFVSIKDQGFYSFFGVTADGNKDEFLNESETLSNINLFIPLLKLVEKHGDMEEKKLNAEIGALIGRKVADFDAMEAEVQSCRRHLLDACEQSLNGRQSTQESLIRYYFSALTISEDDVYISPQTPVEPVIYFFSSRGQMQTISFPFSAQKTSKELAEEAFSQPEVRKTYKRYQSSDFALKVLGKEEYLMDSVPFIQYKYVHDCMSHYEKPLLVLVPFEDLVKVKPDKFVRPVYGQQSGLENYSTTGFNPFVLSRGTIGKEANTFFSTWHLRDTYRFKVLGAKNVNVIDTMKIYLRAALYHGDQSLCRLVYTKIGATSSKTEWNELLEFDLPVCEMPRTTKLCIVLYQKRSQGRSSKDDAPLAWVNFNAFDYAGVLQSGRYQLYCWPIGEAGHELQDQVNSIGSAVLNTNRSDCIELTIDIPALAGQSTVPVMFPPPQEVEQFAFEMSQGSISSNMFGEDDHMQLRQLVDVDPLYELDESDKEILWKMRNVCKESYPQTLPQLLQSLNWNNRSDVCQVYLLLQSWPTLVPDKVIELLHFQFADIAVRQWAVQCLQSLSDNKLVKYLLQLVQALKFEPYLDCPLAEFLLRRGLANRYVGHYLFWHMRAEMHVPAVAVRYGVMLEAYCRGCGQYRQALAKQVDALNKWQQLTEELQKIRRSKGDEIKELMKSPHFLKAMEDIRSPLNPSFFFSALNPDGCKVMDSKMRPLWLQFSNLDSLGQSVLHIFKNGDDLRQDMLTLQVMSIMDNLWRQSGLDLRMNPYQCLSMGNQVGLIEVVLKATTIAKIQQHGGGAKKAFDKKVLYNWLKTKNKSAGDLNKAVENFTLSCAGCCVATYVLGIGDRHSDNIMLKENGQLVHIDFGHFLGNFKSKFGVKRERVPFVLTDDFIHIITREQGKNDYEFVKFKRLCEKAFMIIRQKGDLIINLFTLMLSTGIPELLSVDDVRYISNSLCLSKSEDVALEEFRKKFQEATKHSWSVSLNWYIHNVAHAGAK